MAFKANILCWPNSKLIKEFNEDCVDLDCKSEVVTEENGIIYLCEKFSGKLQAIELEIKANMKDQNICKYFYIRSSGCSCSSSRYFEVVGTSSSSIWHMTVFHVLDFFFKNIKLKISTEK